MIDGCSVGECSYRGGGAEGQGLVLSLHHSPTKLHSQEGTSVVTVSVFLGNLFSFLNEK